MATKIRAIRISDELYAKVQEKAGEGKVSAVINELLKNWVKDD